jgi:hypothetical protein
MSNKDAPVHLMSASKKRKTQGNNMDLLESTGKVDMEINYVEQIAANVRQLEEFDAMVFELEFTILTPLHHFMNFFIYICKALLILNSATEAKTNPPSQVFSFDSSFSSVVFKNNC